MQLKRATFKHIESELYSYKDTQKEINKLRDEILHPFDEEQEDKTIVAGSNSVRIPGRPTERIATRLLTHKTLRNLEEIAGAIETIYNLVSDDHRKVIHAKYWSGKQLNWDDVSIQTNMHRNTAMKLRREFILLVAGKIGWR